MLSRALKIRLLFFSAFLLPAVISATPPKTQATAPALLSEAKHYGRIYVSAEPSEEDLAKFKKEKGAVVLDLREVKELGNCSQPASATKLGLKYNRVNFEAKETIDPGTIAMIDKAVEDAGNKPILLFCKSGARAAAYVAIRMAQKDHVPPEESIAAAKEMGLKGTMEKAVRNYLGL